MGSYNPHAAYILGQEWVPIREPDILPDNVTEFGYRWSNGNTVIPVSGCYYIATVPPSIAAQSCDLLAIYPVGTEDQTGPIKTLYIPASAISVTGSGISVTDGVAGLQNPSDNLRLRWPAGASGDIGVNFDTASYAQQLLGKRILDVTFRYAMAATPSDLGKLRMAIGAHNDPSNNAVTYRVGLEGTPPGQKTAISNVSVTDLNPFWQVVANVNLLRDIYPWRYQELNRFAATEPFASRLLLILTGFPAMDASGIGAFWYFCDMQVTYCEEQRVKYGGRRTANINASFNSGDVYNQGPQFVKMVGPDFTVTGSLAAGDYVNTLVHNDLGININLDGAPIINAIRELYQLPNQRGLQIGQSLTVDKTFTVTGSTVLPHLTMHHTGGVVTGSHAYGIRAAAPVYGSITATQEIEDDVAPAVATPFPQVRFYARRFGDTTVALRLIDLASANSVSITVADFDALPEIVDGWKEITLRFVSPPTFAIAAGDPDWRWDSIGETAGNQWQVLVASATSPTGAQQIGPANYLAPTGDQNTLTWQSPAISGLAADTLSDAVLIFSQDPPTVTGFAIGTSTQTVTGFALDCGVPKACIPTGIYCNNVTWSAQTALPVTGFGYYDLQRSDTVDPTWQTIMKATSTTVTGFCDYEARVGVLSSYRLRVANILEFFGAFVTGTATIPAPGVTSPNTSTANSVLIFTSNKRPSSNLAYRMQWEGTPVEQYVFPEADQVQLQQMFGKDFVTAFHPLERGGERFARTILVSAAAIPLKSMANFNSLRDMAWADVPYVCVRDELGNRWYATILVPGGTVRRNRKIYLAQIEVIETTATPFPVNP